MDHRPARRGPPRPLLPHRLHAPSRMGPAHSPEQDSLLQYPIPSRLPDTPHHCHRSQAPGGPHRISRRASHLGTNPPIPSSLALRRSRRWHCPRRKELGGKPPALLSPGSSSECFVPRQVPLSCPQRLRLRPDPAPRQLELSEPSECISSPSLRANDDETPDPRDISVQN